MKRLLFLPMVVLCLSELLRAQDKEPTPVPTPRLGSLSAMEQARVKTEEKRSNLEARFEKKQINEKEYQHGLQEYRAEIKEYRKEAAKTGSKKDS